ncbi:alpha-mannosidase [Companilactobacillus zhachilii]|uniref:Alpha-mannosidase n=1 Tax=Companilactobacillus zhachilii TaxID=2304606 RepID=A0A386PXA2_9LACO|nr:glycoside hydrolase family 38 C-terminal domain-containing protein [Companilactobacillus zhachilii]AYE39190.1 alpha-mannosidase [Companilactobacillus zhachilii]
MTKAYLVNHTHWDREWYFTDIDAQVLADYLFTEALNELQKQPDLNFTLDGQSSIVDEYLITHPEKLIEIKQLVKENRLFVGPWYTQTDAVNIDAESFLHNAIVGITDTKKKYGNPMMIGYLPDTFGFNANLPALMEHIGLKNFIFWRGMNYDAKVKSPYFKWVAPGGQSITAINLPPTGYSAAVITDQTKENLKKYVNERLDKTIEFVHNIRGDDIALMPVGMDQVNIVKDSSKTLKEINDLSENENIISDYPSFCESLKSVKLPVYSGELRDPVYARVHKTIGSVRSDQKLKSAHLEQVLLKRIEPLMVIAKKNNISISTSLLIQAWKLLFENQAHDSMGGSVTDNVAIDIDHRYKQAFELCDSIENLIKNKLSESMSLNDHDLLLINTSTSKFNGLKKFQIVSSTPAVNFEGIEKAILVNKKKFKARNHILVQTDEGAKFITEPAYYKLNYDALVELPALGYKVFHFKESNESDELVKSNINNISNNDVVVCLDDGDVVIKTKSNQNYRVCLVDEGNDGDTYDYSPLPDDKEVELKFDKCEFQSSSILSRAIFEGKNDLPVDLMDRKKRSTTLKAVNYKLIVELNQSSPLVNVDIEIDNNINSHRMRLKIKHNLNTSDTLAQIQGAFWNNKNHPIPSDWKDNYVEKPVNIFSFNKSVTVNNGLSAMSVITNDAREYESTNEAIYLTLFASTGELGKPNLAWRPGRASGDTTNQGHIMMKTPLAQTKGLLKFNIGLLFLEKFSKKDLVKNENVYLTQNIFYQTQQLNRFINRLDNKIWPQKPDEIISKEQSDFELPDDISVSAIYPSFTDDNKFVVRLVNLGESVVSIPDILKSAKQVNALENTIKSRDELEPEHLATFLLDL